MVQSVQYTDVQAGAPRTDREQPEDVLNERDQ
jgi:hypothetical protein